MQLAERCAQNTMQAICCLIILIILGPILFIVGLSMLVSAPFNDSRDRNIEQMNEAIVVWSNTQRALFSNVTVTGYSTEASSVPFTQRTPSFSAEISDSKDIDAYQPLHYRSTASYFSNTQYNENARQGLSVRFSSSVDSWVNISVPLFFTRISQDNQDTCTNRRGRFINNRCEYYNAIEGICMQVNRDSLGRWDTDNTYGDFGCEYRGDNGENWSPFSYRSVSWTSNLFTQQFNFGNIEVLARSHYDPYIAAQEITRGSMSFGLTKAQTAAVGLGLMIVGIIFCLPCCAFGAIMAYVLQKKRRG